MTAPVLALDALCGSPACHGHRCPRVRHGYVRGELRGKCSQHRHCRAFELDELASLDAAPTDCPAGAVDAVPGEPRRPLENLPGTNPAPTPVGVVAASPPEGGQPAAEVTLPTSAAGRIPLGTTWLCRAHRCTVAAPGSCPTCGEPLDRHHIYAERADDAR